MSFISRIFLLATVLLTLAPDWSQAQSATQTVTIVLAERHSFSVSADQLESTRPRLSYHLQSSAKAKKITGALLEGDMPVEISLEAPKRGFATGLRTLTADAHDLVVGYFPFGAEALGIEFNQTIGDQRPVVRLTVTD